MYKYQGENRRSDGTHVEYHLVTVYGNGFKSTATPKQIQNAFEFVDKKEEDPTEERIVMKNRFVTTAIFNNRIERYTIGVNKIACLLHIGMETLKDQNDLECVEIGIGGGSITMYVDMITYRSLQDMLVSRDAVVGTVQLTVVSQHRYELHTNYHQENEFINWENNPIIDGYHWDGQWLCKAQAIIVRDHLTYIKTAVKKELLWH